MLVLSRHRDESIILNPGTPDEIVIVVVDIRNDKIRLGIKAPPRIVAHRSEVWEAIQRDQRLQVEQAAARAALLNATVPVRRKGDRS